MNRRGFFAAVAAAFVAPAAVKARTARKIGATLKVRKPMRFVGASRGDSDAYRVVTGNTLMTERQVALDTLEFLIESNPLDVNREYAALFEAPEMRMVPINRATGQACLRGS